MNSKHQYLLYHWAPVSRRRSIAKRGLVPGRFASPGRTKGATYSYVGDGRSLPWVCFATNPCVAWALSAAHHRNGRRWDLWMMWSHHVPRQKILRKKLHGCGYDMEHRVLCRIPAKSLWRVGSRVKRRVRNG